MADTSTSAKQVRIRVKRTTTWGNPPPLRTPAFIAFFGIVLKRMNLVLRAVMGLLVVIAVGLLIYLAYGVTYSRLWAADGTRYSCEVAIAPGVKR